MIADRRMYALTLAGAMIAAVSLSPTAMGGSFRLSTSPEIDYFTGSISGAQCSGKYGFGSSPQAHIAGNPGFPEDLPGDPELAIPVLLVIEVILILIEVGLLISDLAANGDQGTLTWDYTCTVDSLYLETNGHGSVARRVYITGWDVQAKDYVPVGTPCDYAGAGIQDGCLVPASATFLGPFPAGYFEGEAHYPYTDNPPPLRVAVCVDPIARAVNAPQYETLDVGPFEKWERLFSDRVCQEEVSVIWNG